MLRNTFVHLPGIGPQRERSLWEQGILDWEGFLAAAREKRHSGPVRETAVSLVTRSIDALARGDACFFKPFLRSSESWRLYSEFASQAVFLDIETTGLSGQFDDVTVIGALGRDGLKTFIQGINLDEFPAYIAQYPLIISYNGIQFDVPFLRAHFPQARLDQPHIDLRFVLTSLGYKGGLKAVESRLGLRRDPRVRDVDGLEAVRLWHRYHRGDRTALETLILYNATDVANLVELAARAVELKSQRLGFPGERTVLSPREALPGLDAGVLKTWVACQMELAGV